MIHHRCGFQVFVSTVFLVFLMGFSLLPNAYAAGVGTVTDVKGMVQIIRGHKKIFARKGMKVNQTDIVKTGAKSSVKIAMKAGDRISLGYKSKLSISEYKRKGSKWTAKFHAFVGKFLFTVKKKMTDGYDVSTSTAVLGVRGTGWLMHVTPTSTETAGLNGTVSVSFAGKEVAIHSGKFVKSTQAGLGKVIATPAQFIKSIVSQGIASSAVDAAHYVGSAKRLNYKW